MGAQSTNSSKSPSGISMLGLSFTGHMRTAAAVVAASALAITGVQVVNHYSLNAPVAIAQTADAVDSPGTWLGNKTVNGYVFQDRGGNVSTMQNYDIPLGGATVYAQWKDYASNGGTVSPVYATTVNADGSYSIHLPDWTDDEGVVHKWQATSGQKLRVWADNPDESKYSLSFNENAGNFGGPAERQTGSWNGTVGIQVAENYNVSYQEKPQDWLFGETPAESRPAESGGFVRGRSWYENTAGLGDATATPYYQTGGSNPDTPAAGITIRGSYVQDEVARDFDAWKKANRGWTYAQFQEAQPRIMADYEARTGKSAIAETVETVTDAEGKYVLQFNGLWGTSYSSKGISNQVWGDPAGADEGSWAQGNLKSKHINTAYLYVAPVLPVGLGSGMDSMPNAMFQPGDSNPSYSTATGVWSINDQDFPLRLETPAASYSPSYEAATTAGGTEVSIPQTGDTAMPEGTAYAIDPAFTAPEGWNVSIDSATGELKVTPPADAPEGTKLEIPVVVTYPSGTKDTLTATVTVGTPNQAATNDPGYTAGEAAAGTPVTIEQTKDTDMPAGVKYTVDPDFTVPEGWTVNVDEASGAVTVTPPADAQPGAKIDVPVVVTYEDGSTDTATATATVGKPASDQAGENTPSYAPAEGQPGTTVTIDQTGDTTMPDGTKYASDNPAIAVDTATGQVIVNVPADAKPGDVIKGNITVNYPDDTSETTEVSVTVGQPAATDFQPSYGDPATAPAGQATSVPVVYTGDPAPAGTKYAIGQGFQVPDGWEISVNPETGEVTATVAPAGPNGARTEQVTVPVQITYPEGVATANDTANAVFNLDTDGDGTPDATDDDDDGDGISDADEIEGGSDPKDPNSTPQPTEYLPSYTPATVAAGQSNTADVQFGGTQAPEGTTYAIDPSFQAPAGWTVNIDENTGQVTATAAPAGPNGARQEQIVVPVQITYPDGVAGPDSANAVFNLDTDGDGTPDATDDDDDNDGVSDADEQAGGSDPKDPDSKPATDADNNAPAYDDGSGQPGDEVKLPNTGDTDLPENTTFETTSPNITVDATTGEVTVTIPADAKPGDTIEGTVTVTYPDGSKDEVPVSVTVGEPASPMDQFPGEITVPAGGEDTLTPTQLPDGSEVKVKDNAGLDVTIGDEGKVTVKVPEDTEPGTYDVVVTITDKDGNSTDETIKVTVPGDSKPADWEDTNTVPGGTIKVPNTGGNVTDGTTAEVDKPGWTAEIDDNGNLIVKAPADAKEGDTATVTVKDGEDKVIDTVTITVKPEDTVDKPDAGSILPWLIIPLIVGGLLSGSNGSSGSSTPGSSTPGQNNQGSKPGRSNQGSKPGQDNQGSKPGQSNQGAQQEQTGQQQTAQQPSGKSGNKGLFANTGMNSTELILFGGLMVMLMGVLAFVIRRRRSED